MLCVRAARERFPSQCGLSAGSVRDIRPEVEAYFPISRRAAEQRTSSMRQGAQLKWGLWPGARY
jgi:hypothetical protein